MDDWLEAAYEDKYVSDFNEDELVWDDEDDDVPEQDGPDDLGTEYDAYISGEY
jgi:hypothetical protein